MQHITYGQNGVFYFSTEDKRIDTSVPSSQLRFLAKFTNDLSGSVKYAYGQNQTINDRFTKLEFTHNAVEIVFSGLINFKPYGFWKYELYEVSFNDTVPTLDANTAPINETDVANNTSGTHGTVKGLVEQGKLLVSETSGNEQVRYTQYEETTSTNYIHIN
jgi:hypothetical protein